MKRNVLLTLLMCSFVNVLAQQKVMIMEIKSDIDSRTFRYVDLALNHAEKINASAVVIDLNTFGGTVVDAKDISDRLMTFKKPIWIFVNPKAMSAGALISISCDSIYMVPQAAMGAATVIYADGEKAIPKMQASMVSFMSVAATANKRDPKIAAGMVDESLVIEGVKKEGEILSLTTDKAIEYGYCEGQVNSIDDLLKKNNIKNANVEYFHLSATDRIIDFFLNPFISGILILLILAGLYFEFQAPGTIFPIAVSIAALVLYLVPYYLNGLAENWEIMVFFIGVVLLALEIFVIPGFGVAGISGITLILFSLILMMVNNDMFDFEFVKMNDILYATLAAVVGLIGGIVLLIVGSSKITHTKAFQSMALTDTQQSNKGYTANFNKERMVGKTGIAFSVLRPSGRVMIDNTIYDAYTKGGYVEKGTSIEVVGEEGSTLRVKAID